jgi:hypothetical protein
MGVVFDTFMRRRDPNPFKHLTGLLPSPSTRQLSVADKYLGQLIADPQSGIQRRHRLLKNHGHAIAAQIRKLRF